MNNVTVIIPIYNTAATLPRCIDSVLTQTMPASEIILVDDGTPDEAGNIANDYACRYSNIKVIHKKNQGLAEARRTGIDAASSELVMHLDSDDTIPPHAIEFLYGKLTEYNLDMAYGCFYCIPRKGKPFALPHRYEGVMTGEEFVSLNLSLDAHNTSCCNISRKALWTPHIYPPSNMRIPSEDTLMCVRLGFNIERMGQWNIPTYNYYYNPQSLSNAGTLHQLDRWKQYFALLDETLREHGVQEKYHSQVNALKIDHLAFYGIDYDPHDPWVRDVINTSMASHTCKIRILHVLIRFPRLCKLLVKANRMLKLTIKTIIP